MVDPDEVAAANEKVAGLEKTANENEIELKEAKVEQAELELEQAEEKAAEKAEGEE